MYLQGKCSLNNAYIFYFSILSKVNLERREEKFLIPSSFQKRQEKPKKRKIKEKKEFLHKICFRKIRF